jgi:flagellin
MVAQASLAKTQNAVQTTFARLSSGYRINGASDDAAGLGISESMSAQIRSFGVAERNANDGISMAQTADGAAGQISNILQRMRELAVQSSNGALQNADRTNLNTEFGTLKSEVDRIASQTKFNGNTLLSGSTTAATSFQVGINNNETISVNFGGANATGLGINTDDVSSTTNAGTALTNIDSAITKLSALREDFGSGINRLQNAVQNVQSMKVNLSAANSRIRDVDVATETSNLSRNQVLSQAGVSILAQSNQLPQLAFGLLGG